MSVLQEGQILVGPSFNEPMRVETIRQRGNGAWTIGVVGIRSEQFRRVVLTEADLTSMRILGSVASYQGDGALLRLGIQAYSLGIAYEFDPYFGLSISRVDPLLHQLEAVYDYLLKLACHTSSKLAMIRDSAAQPWQPVKKVQHYTLDSSKLPKEGR